MFFIAFNANNYRLSSVLSDTKTCRKNTHIYMIMHMDTEHMHANTAHEISLAYIVAFSGPAWGLSVHYVRFQVKSYKKHEIPPYSRTRASLWGILGDLKGLLFSAGEEEEMSVDKSILREEDWKSLSSCRIATAE